MPDWPSTVPFCVVVDTYREKPRDNVRRSSPDFGPRFSRRRFTAVSTDITFALPDMTLAQKITLQNWFSDDLADGSVAFDADHPVTGEAKTFSFNAPPEVRASGNLFAVTINLEQLP